MTEKLLKLEEVAFIVGVSCKTIDNWYSFKRRCPDSEYAKMLPEVYQTHERQTRYWKESDIWKLIDFRCKKPRGRNGVMGILRKEK